LGRISLVKILSLGGIQLDAVIHCSVTPVNVYLTMVFYVKALSRLDHNHHFAILGSAQADLITEH